MPSLLQPLPWIVWTLYTLTDITLAAKQPSYKATVGPEKATTLFSYTHNSLAAPDDFLCDPANLWQQSCYDFPDNPVRFGLNYLNQTVFYASCSHGYWASRSCYSVGESTPLNLSCFNRLKTPLLTSPYPLTQQKPEQYRNRIWMMSGAYSRNGKHIMALIHNEFHGDATGNRTYCSGSSSQWLSRCWYANVILAYSNDGGHQWDFHSSHPDRPATIASPLPYIKDAGRQGYTSQSNVVLHDDGYFYVLILNMVCGQQRNLCANVRNPLLTKGVSLWRSQNGVDWRGMNASNQFSIPGSLNPYSFHYTPLASYLPKAILPPAFRFGLYQHIDTGTWIALGQTNAYRLNFNNTVATVTLAYSNAVQGPWDTGVHGQGYCIHNHDNQCLTFSWGDSPTERTYPSLVDTEGVYFSPEKINYQYQLIRNNTYLCFTSHHLQRPPYGKRNKDIECQPLQIQFGVFADTKRPSFLLELTPTRVLNRAP